MRTFPNAVSEDDPLFEAELRRTFVKFSSKIYLMKIHSSAFKAGASIPKIYTQNGANQSPPLSIEDVPTSAKSLTLIVEDPDAPKGTVTHWILFDFDPKTSEILEGQVPPNSRQGANVKNEPHYTGPKPPSGEHRYFFKLSALDTKLNLPNGAVRAEIEKAMQGHVIASAELMGRYAAPAAVAASA